MPGNKTGKWTDPAVELPGLLSPAIPTRMSVIAMTDRGLRSPKLREKIQSLGWHPYMRQRLNAAFRPDGGKRTRARKPVKTPNSAFIGAGTAFGSSARQIRATIIVIRVEGQTDPRIILTDMEPDEAGASRYALRFWIETGFKALKSVGWQWQKTRRTDPARAERRCLVLATATLLALAYGAREEDAEALDRLPSALRAPPKAAPVRSSGRGRLMCVFSRGADALRRRLIKGGMWRRIRLLPEPWPDPPAGLEVVIHPNPLNIPQQAHKGRRDTLASIRACLRADVLIALWIPAFAGMTGWIRAVSHSSLLTPHSSLLTPHSSLLSPHSSLLTPLSSLLTLLS